MNRMKQFFVAILMVLAAGTTMLAPTAVYADSAVSDACNAINAGGDCKSGANGTLTLEDVVAAVVKILSIVIGVAAIFMIIFAGMKYVTSGGDSSAVASAKNMIIYALVGIVVAAMAFYLVGFVLTKVK